MKLTVVYNLKKFRLKDCHPPRRPGHLRHPHHPVTGGSSKPSTSVPESGYQDRIF